MKTPAPTAARNGFSLAEVLVVISIIILLIVILMPSLSRAREQARSVVCLSQLSQIGAGAAMYRNNNRDWLPISPAEKLSPGAGEHGRKVAVLTTCHWGGRRAEWLHGGSSETEPGPETEIRPLTPYLYPGADLDASTPVFRCPSDRATDWSDALIPNAPIYRVCGNSYYINMFGESPFPARPTTSSTSSAVLYMEAPLYFLLASGERGNGWHGRYATHNLLFLDLHAAGLYVDSRERSGPKWTVSDFLAMDGFYPSRRGG